MGRMILGGLLLAYGCLIAAMGAWVAVSGSDDPHLSKDPGGIILVHLIVFALPGLLLILWGRRAHKNRTTGARKNRATGGAQGLADIFNSMDEKGAENFAKLLNQMGGASTAAAAPPEKEPPPNEGRASGTGDSTIPACAAPAEEVRGQKEQDQEKATRQQEQLSLSEAVQKLVRLYERSPGGKGFMTRSLASEPVREVGEALNRKGGMDLMLEAHGAFARLMPHSARNLEMVWDGIGGWQG